MKKCFYFRETVRSKLTFIYSQESSGGNIPILYAMQEGSINLFYAQDKRERVQSHFNETRRSIDEALVGANKLLKIPSTPTLLGYKKKFEFCQRENHQIDGREGNSFSARK